MIVTQKENPRWKEQRGIFQRLKYLVSQLNEPVENIVIKWKGDLIKQEADFVDW